MHTPFRAQMPTFRGGLNYTAPTHMHTHSQITDAHIHTAQKDYTQMHTPTHTLQLDSRIRGTHKYTHRKRQIEREITMQFRPGCLCRMCRSDM